MFVAALRWVHKGSPEGRTVTIRNVSGLHYRCSTLLSLCSGEELFIPATPFRVQDSTIVCRTNTVGREQMTGRGLGGRRKVENTHMYYADSAVATFF